MYACMYNCPIPLYFFLCFFLILKISLCFIVFLVKKIEQYARKALTMLRKTGFGGSSFFKPRYLKGEQK